jgi:hypothetical protein
MTAATRRERAKRRGWDDLRERVIATLAGRLSEPGVADPRGRAGGGSDAVSRAVRLRAVGLLERDWKEAD